MFLIIELAPFYFGPHAQRDDSHKKEDHTLSENQFHGQYDFANDPFDCCWNCVTRSRIPSRSLALSIAATIARRFSIITSLPCESIRIRVAVHVVLLRSSFSIGMSLTSLAARTSIQPRTITMIRMARTSTIGWFNKSLRPDAGRYRGFSI